MARLVIHASAIDDIATSPQMTAFLLRVAEAGRDGAKRYAHVITGELRDGIEAEAEPGEARFGTNVPQGAYEELGAQGRPPHLWLRPSIDDARIEARRG